MRVIKPSYEILMLTSGDEILKFIEKCGRLCWQSEGKATEDSAEGFVRMLLRKGHESVIEHVSMTVKFIIDRGVSHELVRHRLCAFSQESTRYCNYSQGEYGSEITVIKPLFWSDKDPNYDSWYDGCVSSEDEYLTLIANGVKAQAARSVLPNSLKTEIIVTANLREWRHIFKLRCSAAAHPQMREVMCKLLWEVKGEVPVLFEDIESYPPEQDFNI